MTALRVKLSQIAAAILVAAALFNFWQLHVYLGFYTQRSQHDPVIWEQRVDKVRALLLEVGYRGNIGFVRPSFLSGQPSTSQDNVRWAHMRYAMIPWNVVENTLEPDFVIVDYQDSDLTQPAPAGFQRMLDEEGLLLLRREAP